MVALPVEIGEDNKCLSECSIGASCVLEKEDIKSDIFMQGILKSSISRKWQENGIIIDEKLIVNKQIQPYFHLFQGEVVVVIMHLIHWRPIII